jgi:hypothetical protein
MSTKTSGGGNWIAAIGVLVAVSGGVIAWLNFFSTKSSQNQTATENAQVRAKAAAELKTNSLYLGSAWASVVMLATRAKEQASLPNVPSEDRTSIEKYVDSVLQPLASEFKLSAPDALKALEVFDITDRPEGRYRWEDGPWRPALERQDADLAFLYDAGFYAAVFGQNLYEPQAFSPAEAKRMDTDRDWAAEKFNVSAEHLDLSTRLATGKPSKDALADYNTVCAELDSTYRFDPSRMRRVDGQASPPHADPVVEMRVNMIASLKVFDASKLRVRRPIPASGDASERTVRIDPSVLQQHH